MCHSGIAGVVIKAAQGPDAESTGVQLAPTTAEVNCGGGAGEENDVSVTVVVRYWWFSSLSCLSLSINYPPRLAFACCG